jgi:hypothetical protein
VTGSWRRSGAWALGEEASHMASAPRPPRASPCAGCPEGKPQRKAAGHQSEGGVAWKAPPQ